PDCPQARTIRAGHAGEYECERRAQEPGDPGREDGQAADRAGGPHGHRGGETHRRPAGRDRRAGDPAAHRRADLPRPGRAQGRRDEAGPGAVPLRGGASAGARGAGRLFGLLMPGLDVKPLLEELKDRISEELDYELEAMSQQMFADAYAGDPDIYVPNVAMATGQVLVSDWMDGTPLSRIIAEGS